MLANSYLISTGHVVSKLCERKMRKILKNKPYTHIDQKKNGKDYLNKVKSPKWIVKHGFYPFIHFEMTFKKYIEKTDGQKEKKPKVRKIYYAAHVDRFIYEYYGNELNNIYNDYAKSYGTNNAVIAYRNNKHGLNNIDFAKEVFEFISKSINSYIFIADFSDFFDNLEHSYLKKMICTVSNKNQLDDAEYKIFKSITQYSYLNRDDIFSYMNITVKEGKGLDKFFETKEFHECKKQYLQKHRENYGIPQGSSISSVYANVYMIEFDKIINDYVTSKGGLYRRYCDDIIICIPTNKNTMDEREIINHKEYILGVKDSIPKLIINNDKTEEYLFINNSFKDSSNKLTTINYLGFSFDGVNVRLREKSLFKYYTRAYKKVRSVNLKKGQDKIAAKKALYRSYTHLGDVRNKVGKKDSKGKTFHGNFITYARKAHEKFSNSTCLTSLINRQYKRHWKRINDRLMI
jgi:hypothetical protein